MAAGGSSVVGPTVQEALGSILNTEKKGVGNLNSKRSSGNSQTYYCIWRGKLMMGSGKRQVREAPTACHSYPQALGHVCQDPSECLKPRSC